MSLCGNGTDRVVDLTLEVSHILLSSNSKEKEEEHDQHCRNNMIMINKIIISSYNQLLLASEDLSRSLRLFHARSSVKLLYPHLTTSAAVYVANKMLMGCDIQEPRNKCFREIFHKIINFGKFSIFFDFFPFSVVWRKMRSNLFTLELFDLALDLLTALLPLLRVAVLLVYVRAMQVGLDYRQFFRCLRGQHCLIFFASAPLSLLGLPT
jgi:hypothetical protein